MNRDTLRSLQARLNTNMETFAARYEIPTFYDGDLFDGWRIAEVGAVSKLFWKRDARVRGLALLALWCDAPLHDIPCVKPNVLDRAAYDRVRAALLPRHSCHTLYVDARHVMDIARRRQNGEALAVIGADVPHILFLAGVYLRRDLHRDLRRSEASEDDLFNTDWE